MEVVDVRRFYVALYGFFSSELVLLEFIKWQMEIEKKGYMASSQCKRDVNYNSIFNFMISIH